jgi:hypothetical protein
MRRYACSISPPATLGAVLRRRHHLSLFFCLLFDERQTLAWFRDCPRTAEGVRCYLTRRLTPLWTNRWNKAITECPPPRPPTRYFKGGHSSAERILRGEHQLAAEPPHRHRLRCSKRQAGSATSPEGVRTRAIPFIRPVAVFFGAHPKSGRAFSPFAGNTGGALYSLSHPGRRVDSPRRVRTVGHSHETS